MNNNNLTDDGMKYLLKSIKKLKVEYLYLSNNNLDETSLDYLISFRKYNKSLKTVFM